MTTRATLGRCLGRLTLSAVLATLVAALGTTSVADAAVRAKLDRDNEIRFVLDGRTLRATIVDRPNVVQSPTIQRDLFDHRIRFACGTSFRRKARKTVAVALARWPQGTQSMTVTLGRDISAQARWCLLEGFANRGGDVAYVSFHRAEPGRRVTRGRTPGGVRWRLVAWRGDGLQPCIQLRVDMYAVGKCFFREAEREAGLEAVGELLPCTGEILILGVASRRARAVDVVLADGATVAAALHRRPRGSRVRAQYLVAELPASSARVKRVVARDAKGRPIARDRGRIAAGMWPRSPRSICGR